MIIPFTSQQLLIKTLHIVCNAPYVGSGERLTTTGVTQMERIGRLFRPVNCADLRICASSALYAVRSAEVLAGVLGFAKTRIEYTALLRSLNGNAPDNGAVFGLINHTPVGTVIIVVDEACTKSFPVYFGNRAFGKPFPGDGLQKAYAMSINCQTGTHVLHSPL